jgi:uncharacterized protein
LDGIEIRESGAGAEYVTMRGHAAVFNRDSLDLGGFTERIAPNAFADALNGSPDVHLVSEHDMARPLARTKNGTLELREDPFGLHVWARINTHTSYGKDEVVKLRDGLVDGMSFAFTVNPQDEEWDTRDDGTVVRTINRVSGLYDVSVVAQGAYPAAHAELVARAYRRAVQEGRADAGHDFVAEVPGEESAAPSEGSESNTEDRRAAVLRARLRVAQSKSL